MSEKDQETPGEAEAQAPGEDAAPETAEPWAGGAEAEAARIAELEAEVAEHKDHAHAPEAHVRIGMCLYLSKKQGPIKRRP